MFSAGTSILNLPNLTGWFNLGFRFALSFGLIALVPVVYGGEYVKPWLIYVTLISSVHAWDGLMSQYFVREIINTRTSKPDLTACHAKQVKFYLVASSVFSIITYYTIEISAMAVLVLLFSLCKLYEGRCKAHMSVLAFQRVELAINLSFFCLLCLVVLSTIDRYELLPIFHILGLIAGLIVKAIITRKWLEKSKFWYSVADANNLTVKKISVWKSSVISFGGSLSTNISLLFLQMLIGDKLTASYLFTYRVIAIVCEFTSLPLFIRMPEITRKIFGNAVLAGVNMFKINYRIAIISCFVSLAAVNVASHYWNIYTSIPVYFATTLLVILISLSWAFERIGTLTSQMLLSMREYSIMWAYIIHLALLTLGVVVSSFTNSVLEFTIVLVLSNAIVAIVAVTLARRKIRV